jgi:hypothetical protein
MAVMSRRDTLMSFLDSSASKRFDWSDVNCMIELALWIDKTCGTALAPAWRGLCATEAEWNELITARGGLLTVADVEARGAGLVATETPIMGDVAVVEIGGKAMGAIMMPSGRWRMRTLNGFETRRDIAVLKAWSLPCPR